MNLKDHIRSIQDYPKKGILFRDITTLIKNSDAFNIQLMKLLKTQKNLKLIKLLQWNQGVLFLHLLFHIF